MTKGDLYDMISQALDLAQKARIQGTNDIRNFIDPQTAPDPDKVEGLSDREQEQLVRKIVEADEKIIEVVNTLYELEKKFS